MTDFKEAFEGNSQERERGPMGIIFKREKPPEQKICNPASPSDLPEQFQALLQDLGWVRFYLKGQKHLKEHAIIEAEHNRVLGMPPARTEIMDQLKRDYQARQSQRQNRIKSLVTGQSMDGQSIFDDQQAMEELSKTALPSWEEVESAAASLPEGISAKDRSQKLKKLDAQHDYGKCHPESRYVISRRRVEAGLPSGCQSGTYYKEEIQKYDFWDAFIKRWKDRQANRNAPIDPLGLDLQDADHDVQEAWKALGLGKHVSEDSPNTPARGNMRQRFQQFFQTEKG